MSQVTRISIFTDLTHRISMSTNLTRIGKYTYLSSVSVRYVEIRICVRVRSRAWFVCALWISRFVWLTCVGHDLFATWHIHTRVCDYLDANDALAVNVWDAGLLYVAYFCFMWYTSLCVTWLIGLGHDLCVAWRIHRVRHWSLMSSSYRWKVCIYPYVCAYVHVCMCVHVHVCVRACTRACMRASVRVCNIHTRTKYMCIYIIMCICIYAYVVYTYIYIYVCMYIHKCKHIFISVCICYIYTYMYVYVIYICIYIYMYVYI